MSQFIGACLSYVSFGSLRDSGQLLVMGDKTHILYFNSLLYSSTVYVCTVDVGNDPQHIMLLQSCNEKKTTKKTNEMFSALI